MHASRKENNNTHKDRLKYHTKLCPINSYKIGL